jgi:Probable molybdopterin binding domain
LKSNKGRCQSLDTVKLQEFCAHSQVIMPTANSSASKEVVTAALLVIGGKILSGRTKDQNIGYIAEYLAALGIDLKEVRVVGDEERAIIDALNALRHRCAYVFTTGGIGPTRRQPRWAMVRPVALRSKRADIRVYARAALICFRFHLQFR